MGCHLILVKCRPIPETYQITPRPRVHFPTPTHRQKKRHHCIDWVVPCNGALSNINILVNQLLHTYEDVGLTLPWLAYCIWPQTSSCALTLTTFTLSVQDWSPSSLSLQTVLVTFQIGIAVSLYQWSFQDTIGCLLAHPFFSTVTTYNLHGVGARKSW